MWARVLPSPPPRLVRSPFLVVHSKSRINSGFRDSFIRPLNMAFTLAGSHGGPQHRHYEMQRKGKPVTERPDTWVTVCTGHIGDTSSPRGGSDALEGVFGYG